MLQMDAIARQVCPNAGGDASLQREDLETILNTLRGYSLPDALGPVYRVATKCLRYKRADQAAERRHFKFAVLPRKADQRAVTGRVLPDCLCICFVHAE